MTIPHRTLRLKALEQERKWLEADDPDAAPWWKGWQMTWGHKVAWYELDEAPRWIADEDYRFVEKPRTVTVYTKTGAVELPEPMREAPEVGAVYWSIAGDESIFKEVWHGYEGEKCWLINGLIFDSPEHAQAWADFQRMQRLGKRNDT